MPVINGKFCKIKGDITDKIQKKKNFARKKAKNW